MTAARRLDLGLVIRRTFSTIRQRWRPLGFFVVAYLALIWAYDLVNPIRYHAGPQDILQLAAMALAFAFVLAASFRDTALTATAVEPASSQSISRSLSAAATAFPTLALFAVLTEAPNQILKLWERWSRFGARAAGEPTHILGSLLLAELATTVWWLAITAGWGLVIPVVVVERLGLAAALVRAWRLLSGNRWRLLALFVVMDVAGGLPSLLGSGLALWAAETLHRAGLMRTEERIVSTIDVAVFAVWPVMVGVAYLELRRLREGVVAGDVSQIFD
jgi:hypothetical protein